MTRLVVAWGNRFGGKRLNSYYSRAASDLVIQSPDCLGITASGEPKHPLFVKYDTPLVPWKTPR